MKMQSLFHRYGVPLCCVITMLVTSACSLFITNTMTAQEVENQLKEAREHFDIVKSLEIEGEYDDDFTKAQASVAKAQDLLESGHRDKAYATATESLEVCKRILKKFYLDTVVQLARKARTELRDKARGDEDNPLTDFVPKLDEVKKYADELEKDTQILSMSRVLDDLKSMLNVTYSIQTSAAQTLESDVSFAKGEYELSGSGIQIVQKLVGELMADKQDHISKHPGKNVTAKIKVVGYTDQLHFSRESKLKKILVQGIEDKLPRDSLEQRKFLNQRLSEFRADSIVKQIRQFFPTEEANSNFLLDMETVGRGEKLPANLYPPYPLRDPRRRICKVYTYTSVY